MDIRERLSKIPHAIKHLPETIREAITGYQKSYKAGVERFGVWWTVFQLSIWGFVLIFIITAVIIFVVYIPKIEMIKWDLR